MLTIDEAIEINTEVAEMRGKRSTVEKREALWLGIEALKFVEDARKITTPFLQRLLRGEAKE